MKVKYNPVCQKLSRTQKSGEPIWLIINDPKVFVTFFTLLVAKKLLRIEML